jgi:rhamnosyl/mannosyltransferase
VDSVEQGSDYNIEPDIEGPFILFVGRLVNYKGVEYLIDAMNEAEGTLLIVGDGHLKSDLEKRAKRRGVEESIYFLGKVSESKLGEYYKAADVFVLPSVAPNEAFGIVQLEAMARGVPVINTSLPTGVPWVSQDGITGKTVPRDPKALAEAINSILNDDQLRQEYGKQARLRVEEKFSQKKMIQRIEEIYDRLDNI